MLALITTAWLRLPAATPGSVTTFYDATTFPPAPQGFTFTLNGVIDGAGWKLLIERAIDPAFFQGPVYPNKSTSATPPPAKGSLPALPPPMAV